MTKSSVRCISMAIMICITVVVPSASTATLSGSVHNADGDPIIARITILRGSPGSAIETYDTADDGTFSIETSVAGIIAISASSFGYSSRELHPEEDSRIPRLRFALPAIRKVQGQVRDRSGKAHSGVKVRVRYLDRQHNLLLDDGIISTTDRQGMFSLNAGDGRFVVDAIPDDWVPISSRVLGSGAVGSTGFDSGNSYSDIVIELQSMGSIVYGNVTSPSGRSLSGVPVIVVVDVQTPRVSEGGFPGTISIPGGADVPFGNRFRKSTVSNGRGNYEIAGLPPGRLAVVAARRNTRVPVQRFYSSEGASLEADFVLPD